MIEKELFFTFRSKTSKTLRWNVCRSWGCSNVLTLLGGFIIRVPKLHCLSLQGQAALPSPHPAPRCPGSTLRPPLDCVGTRSEGSGVSVADSVTVPLLYESSDKK